MRLTALLSTVILSFFCGGCIPEEEVIEKEGKTVVTPEPEKEPEDMQGEDPGEPQGEDPLPEQPQSDPSTLKIVFIEDGQGAFKWPFKTPAQSKISNTASSPSFVGEEFDCTTLEGGHVLTVFASKGVARNSGSKQGFKFDTTVGDYIIFPAIEGRYLVSVTFVSGTDGACGAPVITDMQGDIVYGGSYPPYFNGKGDSYSWILYGTKAGERYRMVPQSGGTCAIQQLILTYDVIPCVSDTGSPDGAVDDDNKDEIPDFSNVGYHGGSDRIPDYPVRITLEAPKDGSDAMGMIQDALDKVTTPGAVLLKKGTYNISGTLKIERSGVVLRGEGDETILYSTATTQISRLIQLGLSTSSKLDNTSRSPIIARRTAVGQKYVIVRDPGMFRPDDKVFVYRPATQKWIEALHMTEIGPRSDGGEVVQWAPKSFNIYWERKVTRVEGNKVYLDNPIVMEISHEYGAGSLVRGSWERISESGVENLAMDTRFDASKKSGTEFVDEDHCWTAVGVLAAENCWVRGIKSTHFGYACVNLSTGAYFTTVQSCRSFCPVSIVTGSRRYAFSMGKACACLVRDCWCERDRHQFVTGGRTPGPNVFLDCKSVTVFNDAGPHCYWATGVLYDNVKVEGNLNIQDRNNYGTGHGWTAANFVCYNCEAGKICVQSPWVTGQNWAIGCTGEKLSAARKYGDNLGGRPDGIWISYGAHVEPRSLYESQCKAAGKNAL